MAKKTKEAEHEQMLNDLWMGITEEDFLNEDSVSLEDIVEFNTPAMTLFIQNINLFRQLTMEKDGLKPIERRLLYMMYEAGAYMTSKNDRKSSRKSSKIVGDTMGIHAHSDASIYATLVGNGQYWKNAVPLIKPFGNFGNMVNSEEYAHMRYTEALVSYYGYMCFFKDIDKDCLEMIVSTTGGDRKEDDEPMALPSRYPNILVNGGFGMASGNLFCIPPFNIHDIIKNTKQVLRHPETTSIYMIPDFPTECEIIEDEKGIRNLCETGKGSIKMRATIEIDQMKNKDWVLKIKNIPWMVTWSVVLEQILDLHSKGQIPIKDLADHSGQVKDKDGTIKTILNYHIIIDKSHDPYRVRNKLYKLTHLEKPLAVDFNIVTNDLHVERPSLRGMIQMWIDSRREYKRRLYNKTLAKLNARIALLNILIYLTDKSRITKTMDIVSKNSLNNVVSELMKVQKMNSYQANQIINMGLKAFHKDAHEQYVAELKECEKKKADILEIIHSNKKIDNTIADELDELEQWATPRKSKLIKDEGQIEVADTDHVVVVSSQNFIKKLAYKQEAPDKSLGLGNFKNNDFPKIIIPKINNLESVTFFDMYGRYSTVPVYDIESTANTHVGLPIYGVTKLNGPIISYMRDLNPESIKDIEKMTKSKLSIISLSAMGYAKRTPIEEFMGQRNASNTVYAKTRPDDFIVYADLFIDDSNVLLYSAQGDYVFINGKDISSQSKQGTGVQTFKLADEDQCVGLASIGKMDTHLIVVTEKGLVKRCETSYMGDPGKRKMSSYLMTLDPNDKVIWVGSVEKEKNLCIYTRTEYIQIEIEKIPVLGRKAKGKKLIPIPLGSNVIDIKVI